MGARQEVGPLSNPLLPEEVTMKASSQCCETGGEGGRGPCRRRAFMLAMLPALLLLLLLVASCSCKGGGILGGVILSFQMRPESSMAAKCAEELEMLRMWSQQAGLGQAAEGLAAPTTNEEPLSLAGSSLPSRQTSRRSLLQAAGSKASLVESLREKTAQVKELRDEQSRLKIRFAGVNYEKFMADYQLSKSGFDWAKIYLTPEIMQKAGEVLDRCGGTTGMVVSKKDVPLWKGYSCTAQEDELRQYFDYEPRKACPDDWLLVQDLIYVQNCFGLPKRRCLNRTPKTSKEPLPFPASLFEQAALSDENVRWDLHWCKSFECLNTRSVGDCRNCFNLTLEKHRWRTNYRGALTIPQIISMKKGSLRLGLDAGGGTGSFAAHMALHNVTVMTTAMNIETVKGRMKGLPYMEAISLRGLVPLWVPHKSRLPFFDNTLDIIHCVNSIKYLPMLEFEELLFEWDRVLRVGGLLWFEMFYAPVDEMPIYVKIIELLGYKKLYWNVTPKPDTGERKGAHMYLNCALEKPVRHD